MGFFLGTKINGFKMTAKDEWNGDKDLFCMGGHSDSDCNNQEDQKSVSGITLILNEMVIQVKSKMQLLMTLSVTEVELEVAMETVQYMMCA